MPLPLGPLYAALVGAVSANAALFFAYVEWMTHFDEPIWNLCMFASVVIGGVSLPFSSKIGAGGKARIGLRFVTMAGLAVALAVIIIVFGRIALRRVALHI